MKLDRRLNILIYLNHNWKDNNGGHLELWDKEMKNCEKKILQFLTDWSFLVQQITRTMVTLKK